MRPTLLKSLIVLFFSLEIFAQKGEYYLTHFAPDDEKIKNENFAIAQDNQGLMYFANSKGLLKYDGKNWQLIKTPSSVLSVATNPDDGTVYVGCLDEIGYMAIDTLGNSQYKSVYKPTDNYLHISKIFFNSGKAYFKGIGQLFEYSREKKKITGKWMDLPGLERGTAFVCNDKIFLTDKDKGIFTLSGQKITLTDIQFDPGESILFAAPINKYSVLVGTDANRLLIFKDSKFVPIIVEDEKYLKNSILNDGVVLNSNIAFISTNKGGCLMIDINTGKTISIINYFTGLPDDEIFAIAKDMQSGVWVAHEYGFTRIDHMLPFKCFSAYPGLEGHISSAVSFNGQLYTATNEGVYYLAEIKDYTEFTKFVKKKRKEEENNKPDKVNAFNKIKEFFSFGRKKKVKAPANTTIEPDKKPKKILGIFNKKQEPENKKTNKKTTQQKPALSKVQLSAPSIPVKYVFRKVVGIDAKCRQLIVFGNKLIAATNNGIFEIQNAIAVRISSEASSYMYVSGNGKLYTGTENKKLVVYAIEAGKWKLSSQLDMPEEIVNIAEDEKKNIWVSCNNALFKIAGADTLKTDTIKINNPFSDNIHLIYINKKIKVIISSDQYFYNYEKGKLEKDIDSSFKTKSFRLIHSQNNRVWYKEGDSWKYMSDTIIPAQNYNYLNLFRDVQDIIVNQDKTNCWLITKSNGLYLFDISNMAIFKEDAPIFLQSINDNDGNQISLKNLNLEQIKSFVSFNFINPSYQDNAAMQYQYLLKGSNNDEWSEWSSENKAPFNSLPNGSFELIVRSKSSINTITESKIITFNVNPPYWQQWWFYLTELLFFGSLLYISIVMNRSNNINPWFSRILTFITIVMLIEFIEAVMGSFIEVEDSPVNSFIIQVCLAIVILPFERVLSGVLEKKEKAKQNNILKRLMVKYRKKKDTKPDRLT